MRGERLVLQSRLNVEEALDRLRQRTVPWGMFASWGGKDFISRIDGNEFEVWVRRFWGRNDLAPHFIGRIIPGAAGARIDGRFDTGSWVRRFMRILLILGGVFFLGNLVAARGKMELDSPGLLFPIAMVLYDLVVPRLGYLMNRGDEQKLLAFLAENLAAERDASAPIEPQ
jgi:hypothetical protein